MYVRSCTGTTSAVLYTEPVVRRLVPPKYVRCRYRGIYLVKNSIFLTFHDLFIVIMLMLCLLHGGLLWLGFPLTVDLLSARFGSLGFGSFGIILIRTILNMAVLEVRALFDLDIGRDLIVVALVMIAIRFFRPLSTSGSLEFLQLPVDDGLDFSHLCFNYVFFICAELPRLVILLQLDVQSDMWRKGHTSFGSAFVCRKCAIASMFECRILI